MKIQEAIRTAIGSSGNTQAGVSKSVGKTRNYVNAALHQADVNEGTIGCDKAAAMLNVCGYSLVAIPKGTEPPGSLVIDPPEA